MAGFLSSFSPATLASPVTPAGADTQDDEEEKEDDDESDLDNDSMYLKQLSAGQDKCSVGGDDLSEDESAEGGGYGSGPGASNPMGRRSYQGHDGEHSVFNLKVIFDPFKTGFEESKHFVAKKGDIIAGRYQVSSILGQAAFSSAVQCYDSMAKDETDEWVCLKVIKNNKDFFDQSLDEIKLLQVAPCYIRSHADI